MIKKLVQGGNGFNLPIGLPILKIMGWIPSLVPISEISSPTVKITILEDGKSLLLELATEEEIQQNEKLVNNLYRRESETTNPK